MISNLNSPPLSLCIYIYSHTEELFAQSAGAVEIRRLLLCRGVIPPTSILNKQSDGEVPEMLELWGMRSTPSFPSLPGLLWPGVVAPYKGPISRLNRTKWWLEFTGGVHLNCVFMLN